MHIYRLILEILLVKSEGKRSELQPEQTSGEITDTVLGKISHAGTIPGQEGYYYLPSFVSLEGQPEHPPAPP